MSKKFFDRRVVREEESEYRKNDGKRHDRNKKKIRKARKDKNSQKTSWLNS